MFFSSHAINKLAFFLSFSKSPSEMLIKTRLMLKVYRLPLQLGKPSDYNKTERTHDQKWKYLSYGPGSSTGQVNERSAIFFCL